MKKMNKKGLSNVVATVLIVLLALAAIAIIWSFIQPSLQGAGTSTELASKCLTVEAKPVSCDIDGNKVSVQLSGGSVSDVYQLNALVEDSTGNTILGQPKTVDQALQSVEIDFEETDGTVIHDIIPGDKVRAVAIVGDATDSLPCNPSIVEIACVA